MNDMSRQIRVGDSVIVTVGQRSGSYLIRGIAPEGIYISERILGPLSLLKKIEGSWKVNQLTQPHTVQFIIAPKCKKGFFVSDRTTFKEDLDLFFPVIGTQFDCELTPLHQWDEAQIIWKPVPQGLNWKQMSKLEFFNNLFTTQQTLTEKLSLLKNGLATFGEKFFGLHPYTLELGASAFKPPVLPESALSPGLGTQAWITKPSALFGGQGVEVHWDLVQAPPHKKDFILQKYIEHPLLYPESGRKFDIRVLLLLTLDEIKVHPFMYARVARTPYQVGTEDPESNITNLSLHGEYDLARKLPSEISRERIIEFVRQLKPLFLAAQKREREYQERNKIHFHTFDLLGLDIIFDQTMKPWILEVNKDPAFSSKRGGIYAQAPEFLSDTLKEAIFFRMFPSERTTTEYITL